MSITFNGIGSGLDIDSIVGAIVEAERAPTASRLTRIEENSTEEFSAIGQLSQGLDQFLDALSDLNDASLYSGRSTSVGSSENFTASAEEGAQLGSYQIQVESVAESARIATQGVSSADSAVGTGTINVFSGTTSFGVTIDSSNNTLQGIRDAINTSENNLGVTASIVTDDTGSRLVLTSDDTGSSNSVALTVEDDDGTNRDAASGLSQLVYDPTDLAGAGDGGVTQGGQELSAGSDAIIYVDGLRTTSESNTITSAIDGVTLNVRSAQDATDITNGNTINLTVSNDESSVRDSIQNFTDVYNSFMSLVDQLTVVVVNDGTTGNLTGALTGDSTVRNLVSNIRDEFSTPVSGNPDGLQFLVNLGISTNDEGLLEIDNTALDDALSNNFDDIGGLFTGAEGLSERLSSALTGYTGPSGVLSQRMDSLQNTLNDVVEDREALDRRMVQVEARLYSQYQAMDQLVSQLNSTLDFVLGALNPPERD
ncbi:flagellar filament capping protein FliD [Marinibactrum halimedae]|uniref:Flagellar hook-associated protein 2 n=1 Tax=Marinibactrum halimedae TaxID=1444977 RepID=A0AA37T539_9GAMM|nr:flagellar filament capping protein FliD [Marinibactrum halimedae]MCD9460868.1 flagellar filament capping protein FliD [Marinibactrum halimedae]GLS27353.1 B-type flagellar hook-associated protein 2 [Marinibactrum halimedae]